MNAFIEHAFKFLGSLSVFGSSIASEPGVFNYLRPDGTSYYRRPDGTSLYKRP